MPPRAALATPRHHHLAARVDADPVVGERQFRPRFNGWHMATHARLSCQANRRRMARFLVAPRAHVQHLRTVRRMARQARQLPALLEARALGEVERLMACIPRIAEIGRLAARRGLAMTRPAKLVDLGRRMTLRVQDVRLQRSFYVRRSAAMADLAANPRFKRLDALLRRHPKRSRRVALETAQNFRTRRKHSIQNTRIRFTVMSRRHAHRLRLRVVRKAVFDVMVFVDLGNVGGCLDRRSECPLVTAVGGTRQCLGVRCSQLPAMLRGMA